MQPWHWIVVIVVVVILFGSKKLPDAARGLGRSMRILKSEMGEMTGDGKKDEAEQPRELPPSDPAPGAGPGAEARRAADKHADS